MCFARKDNKVISNTVAELNHTAQHMVSCTESLEGVSLSKRPCDRFDRMVDDVVRPAINVIEQEIAEQISHRFLSVKKARTMREKCTLNSVGGSWSACALSHFSNL